MIRYLVRLFEIWSCAGLMLCLATGAAWAKCSTEPYKIHAQFPVAYKDRFAALRSSDPMENRDARQRQWQALIDDAKRETLPDLEILALSRSYLSSELAETGQENRALHLAQDADQLAREKGFGKSPWYPEILSNLALALLNSGKADLGMATAEKALQEAVRHHGAKSVEAVNARDVVARALFGRSRFAEAMPHWREASQIAQQCFPAGSTAILSMMNSYSASLTMMGDFEKGTEEAIRAVNWGMAHIKESNPEFGLSIHNLAADFSFTRQLSEAEPLYRKAIDLQAQYDPNNWDSRSLRLSNFAELLDLQGKHEEADAAWKQSREFATKSSVHYLPYSPVLPLDYWANAETRRGNHQLAIARYREAIGEAEKLVTADSPYLAEMRIKVALTLSTVGDDKSALAAASLAMPVLRTKMAETHPRRLVSEIRFAEIVARAESAEKGYAIAAPVARTLEQRLLGTTTSRADLISSAPIFQISFASVTALALETNRTDEAFRMLQLANLSNLVIANSTTAARAAVQDPVAKHMFQNLQDLIAEKQGLIRARLQAIADSKPEDVSRIDSQLKGNAALIAGQVAELDQRYPAYRELMRPTPVELAAFQARLGPDQILLAPLSFQDGTRTIAVTREGLIWSGTKVPAVRIKHLVKRIRASIDAQQSATSGKSIFDSQAAAELFETIVPPKLRKIFAAHSDLLYYTSGALASIPPALLLTGKVGNRTSSKSPWLIRSHSVTILPSLLERPSRTTARTSRPLFLGVGAPLHRSGPIPQSGSITALRSSRLDGAALRALPALPKAADELFKMRAAFGTPGDPVLVGADMTEAKLRSLPLDQFNIIAFATHGLVGGDFAGLNEPALVMTPEEGVDGEGSELLTASKIAGLHLDADWVILSACNTASGTGEGMPAYGGLATTFMQAGARALLVSHWPVRDDAAEQLTVDTLSNSRLGMTKAKALQQAMLKLMANRQTPNRSHPAVWAPFVLIER